MFTGTYLIAEHRVAISSIYPDVHHLCRNYAISPDGPSAIDVAISVTPDHIQYEYDRSIAEAALEGTTGINLAEGYLETLAVYRQLADALTAHNILLFHGSVIAVDGIAYLFTAQSGTGKSTHTRLWRQLFGDRAVMINDDKPLIRVTPTGATVYGTPWSGKHRLDTNTAAPLRAICALERGRENTIRPVTADEVYPLLLQQTYRSSDPLVLSQALQLLDDLTAVTKLYRLACNMQPEAARVAYDGMASARDDS